MAIHRLYVYRVQSKAKVKKGRHKRPAERFLKIGITSQERIADRFEKYPDAFDAYYKKSLLTSQRFNTREQMLVAEQHLHRALIEFRHNPTHRFSGYSECYAQSAKFIIKSAISAMRLKYTPTAPMAKMLSEKSKKRIARGLEKTRF